MLRIKKDDKIMVITGKDKGKTGRILEIFPQRNKALIEGVNIVKKAQRPTQQDQKGGIIEVERPIHMSNIMLIDKKTNKPSRFGVKILKDGKKERISKKSGEVI